MEEDLGNGSTEMVFFPLTFDGMLILFFFLWTTQISEALFLNELNNFKIYLLYAVLKCNFLLSH